MSNRSETSVSVGDLVQPLHPHELVRLVADIAQQFPGFDPLCFYLSALARLGNMIESYSFDSASFAD
jgi:hypothetical protein